MSKCEIRIVTKDKKIQYDRGETIEGEVTLIVHQPVKCNGLFVEHYVRTSGQGDNDKKIVTKTPLFVGNLEAGTHHYPFSIVIPKNSPVTYNGRLLNISHRLQASVDIPFAFDPKTELELSVSPVCDEPRIIGKKHDIFNSYRWFSEFAIMLVIWFIVVLFAIDLWPYGLMGMFTIAFTVLGALMYKTYKTTEKFASLGLVNAYVTNAPSSNSLSIVMKLAPKNDVYIQYMDASLILREVASSGAGSHRTTLHHSDVVKMEIIARKVKAVGGSSRTIKHEFQLPETMPPNFLTYNNEVYWVLRYKIKTTKHSYDFVGRLIVL